MARKINYTPPAAHSCSRNQQQQGQQFTGCEHTDHLHKRFYFSSTRQLSLQACCLWTKMEQQFPKIGGPENRAQKSFQNWTYLLAEREEVFSLFYTLGSQIMTPKWAQNWDPKMGSKLLLQPLKPPQKHTHTHTDTHLQDRRTRIAKLVRQKIFCRSQIKNPLWGARRALPEIHGCRHPQFWSPNLLHFVLLETALREPTHTTQRHTIQDNRRPQGPTDPQNMPNHQPN